MRIVILTIIIVLSISCTDSGTEPKTISHEFIWEIDTILPQAFQFVGLSVWGSSEDNVYLGGHDADGHQSLLQYNGDYWKIIDLWRLGFNTISAIDGIDSSNIAIVGDGGLRGTIGIYRNGRWDTLRTPWLRPIVTGVDMVSINEIYISSIDGILKHDGSNYVWIVDSSSAVEIPTEGPPFYPGCVKKGMDGMVYFPTVKPVNNPKYDRMNMFDGNVSRIIEENLYGQPMLNKKAGWYLRMVGNKLLTGYNEIYSLNNGELHLEHKHVGSIMTGTDVSNNLFATERNSIFHFNGIDWVDVTPQQIVDSGVQWPISDIFYIDSTLFVIADFDGYHTLIYRGKHK